MRIVIIGSGNIAHFFAPRLQEKGHEIIQVYSPEISHAKALAKAYNIAAFTNNLNEINQDGAVYILAVKDDALNYLNTVLRLKDKTVLHCAGAVSLNEIKDISKQVGVIWTLYSIRKNNLPTSKKIPLIVEANNDKTLKIAMELAYGISDVVLNVDFEQRQMLHLNAVFVNNFTNHLYTIAQKLSEENQLPFDILLPIIQQTFVQTEKAKPSENQTGPAIRNDEATIQKHLSLLKNHADWQKIYTDISRSIQQTNHN